MKNRRAEAENGFYLVFLAILLSAILSIVALLFGVSYLSYNRARIQHISNLAALAAIEEFTNQTGTYLEKSTAALTRATEIAAANNLLSTPSSVSWEDADLIFSTGSDDRHGTGGEMVLGNWYPQDPDGLSGEQDPCTQSYPCFSANAFLPSAAPAEASANSVMLTLRNKDANPIVLPLANFLGEQNAYVSASATSSVIDRCVAFLLDISRSTYIDTHPLSISDIADALVARENEDGTHNTAWDSCVHGRDIQPYYCLDTASLNYLPSLATFKAESIEGSPGIPLNDNDCYERDTFFRFAELEYQNEAIVWCNMAPHRGNTPSDSRTHFRSDYSRRLAPWEPSGTQYIYFDTFYKESPLYRGPQPFTTFMHAFNAGSRAIAHTKSAGDRMMFLAFDGAIRSQLPTENLTNQILPFVQLTNALNRGMTDGNSAPISGLPELHTNFIDTNWFSTLSTNPEVSSTNLVGALDQAIFELNSCPSSARKIIVAATDGAATCVRNGGDNPPPPGNPKTWTYLCGSDYDNHYRNSEIQLSVSSRHTLARQMAKNRISFSVLLSGSYVRPHFKNIWSETLGHFLTFTEAISLGYGGFGWPPVPSDHYFMDPKSCIPDGTCGTDHDRREAAFNNMGSPGYIFGRPNGAMLDMTFQTGGIFCPLMPNCSDLTCYVDHDSDPNTPKRLKDDCREDGEIQTCSLELLSEAEQAADCVIKSLGQNPFILVDAPPSE